MPTVSSLRWFGLMSIVMIISGQLARTGFLDPRRWAAVSIGSDY